MKIVSWNVNGIRANEGHGFLGSFKKIDADIFCMQEIKAKPEQFPIALMDQIHHYLFINSATKPGYSGVAIYTKQKPLSVITKIGNKRFDTEGRFLLLEFADFILVNIYVPHGGRQKENLDYKLDVYGCILDIARQHKDKGMVLIGDFNIAHQEIDLERPNQNKNNIMFTPTEREQLDRLVNLGFVDTFRKFNEGNGHYTWWPYMANARERNLGWRIDYCFVSKLLEPNIMETFIYSDVMGSDHCPIGVELKGMT